MRLDNLAPVFVRSPDDRAFQNGRMRQKRRLHLGSGNVVAGGNDHVIAAGGKMEAALLVLPEAIPGQVPALLHIGPLAGIGQIAAAGRAAHGQTAHLAARQLTARVIDDPCLIPCHRPPRRRGAMIVKAVGQEDMQHFGGANAIQHRLAGAPDPLVIDRRGQGFARAHRGAQR